MACRCCTWWINNGDISVLARIIVDDLILLDPLTPGPLPLRGEGRVILDLLIFQRYSPLSPLGGAGGEGVGA